MNTVEARRRHIFDAYVQRMQERRRTDQRYLPEQTIRWLAWLAQKLSQNMQSVFLIEQVPPSWLSTDSQRWAYVLTSRLFAGPIVGLVGGLLFGLIGGLIGAFTGSAYVQTIGLKFGLLFGLIGGLAGLIVGIIDGARFEHSHRNKKAMPVFDSGRRLPIKHIPVVGLIVGLAFGLILDSFPIRQVGFKLVVGLYGLAIGLIFGLICEVMFVRRDHGKSIQNDIEAVEAMSWLWEDAKAGAIRWLVGGLIVGLILGLLMMIIPESDFYGDPLILSVFGLIGGLTGGMSGAVIGGLRGNIVEGKTTPNQGIWLSARNALSVALILWLILGLAIGLVDRWFLRDYEWANVLIWINVLIEDLVSWGLFIWSIAMLRFGALEFIKHFTLRFILYRNGHIPWNLVRFLDYATERIFLRKLDGGYIFVHRLLQEYFASLEDDHG